MLAGPAVILALALGPAEAPAPADPPAAGASAGDTSTGTPSSGTDDQGGADAGAGAGDLSPQTQPTADGAGGDDASPANPSADGAGQADATAAVDAVPWIRKFRPPPHLVEVGIHGGVFIPTQKHELYDHARPWRAYPPATADLVLRVGYYPLSFAGVEAEAALMPTSVNDSTTIMYGLRGHAVFQLPLYSLVPYVLVGGGALGTSGDALGEDLDPSLHVGLGLKVFINRWVAVRVGGRAHIGPAFGREGGRSEHGEILVGVVISLNRAPADTDRDGLYDPGETRTPVDACPLVRGTIPHEGCPDRDRDGVRDLDDVCPDDPGLVERDGCPPPTDGDGDGFFDPGQHKVDDAQVDDCPDVAGDPRYKGCPIPDTDGDGILDPDDACLAEAETVNGFEDDDGCPDEVPLDVSKVLGAIRGIHFAFMSAQITDDSKATLDASVEVLKTYPSLRMAVHGHTDTDGDPEFNKKLSRRRAEAVRQYFIAQGVAGERLRAEGFGGERPVADDATEEGRAQNRRIEFLLLDKQGKALKLEDSASPDDSAPSGG